jgi:hypothetical protein
VELAIRIDMKKYSKEELLKMPDVSTTHLSMYVEIPKGYIGKVCADWENHVLYNPESNHVLVYEYYETMCYVTSASDEQANGHYRLASEGYTPQELKVHND